MQEHSPMNDAKHWSKVEYLHESVHNPNIRVKGTHSYYSPAWSGSFEESAVRYLYGDEYSRKHWEPAWPIDRLHVGDYVCIGPEAVILMGGNHTHRADWFSCYPHIDHISDAYIGKGDTVLGDGCWLGMRSMLMPGVRIGEGAIVASGAVVTANVAPYIIVGGNPARPVKPRFSVDVVSRLMALHIYDWPDEKFRALTPLLCGNDIAMLEEASRAWRQ